MPPPPPLFAKTSVSKRAVYPVAALPQVTCATERAEVDALRSEKKSLVESASALAAESKSIRAELDTCIAASAATNATGRVSSAATLLLAFRALGCALGATNALKRLHDVQRAWRAQLDEPLVPTEMEALRSIPGEFGDTVCEAVACAISALGLIVSNDEHVVSSFASSRQTVVLDMLGIVALRVLISQMLPSVPSDISKPDLGNIQNIKHIKAGWKQKLKTLQQTDAAALFSSWRDTIKQLAAQRQKAVVALGFTEITKHEKDTSEASVMRAFVQVQSRERALVQIAESVDAFDMHVHDKASELQIMRQLGNMKIGMGMKTQPPLQLSHFLH